MCIRDRFKRYAFRFSFWINCFFLEFKKRVIENYPELFTERDTEEVDLSTTGSFSSKWGFYQSVYGIAKGDATKFDEVTRLNVHKCFLHLVFEKEKNELEKRLIKQRK